MGANGIRVPKDRPNVARRLAAIMAQQRRGLEAPEYAKRGGRVDRRRLASVSVGNDRVFSTRTGQSATRLRVVVIIDLSGSMHGDKAQNAVQTAWDFALASAMVPTCDLEIWGHTTGYLNDDEKPLPQVQADADVRNAQEMEKRLEQAREYAKRQSMTPEETEAHVKYTKDMWSTHLGTGVREGHYVAAFHLWEKGMTARGFYEQFKDIDMSGNEDGWSLDAILREVTSRAKSNERVLAIMVSDGAPAYSEGSLAFGHIRAVVNRWRKRGVGIVSVSIDGSLRKEAQNNMYGHEWVVPYETDYGGRYWFKPEPGMSKGTVTKVGRIIGRALA